MSLSRKEIMNRFFAVTERAEKYNSKPGNMKRFFPMTESRKGHISVIGLYDYETKKHVLCDILSWEIDTCVDEMEKMLVVR